MATHGTRPDNLNSSSKRQHFLSLYSSLLPVITPLPPSLLHSFKSTLSFKSPLEPQQLQAVYDTLTTSISVHGDQDMTDLWRRGFFGKGSLSRSEPSWKRRVENKRATFEGRESRLTAEEVTALRRIERKGTKMIKKLEREAEKLLAASAAASERGSSIGTPPTTHGGSRSASLPNDVTTGTAEDEAREEELVKVLEKIVEEREGVDVEAKEEEPDETNEESKAPAQPPPLWQLTAEHTQLQPEEAFFLIFSLGVLSLRSLDPFDDDSLSAPMSILNAWERFLLDTAVVRNHPPTAGLNVLHPALKRWDSPFLINYAVYHHYRSMGWVARSGVKFCVDWVLYGQGGPVGGHAEFAVVVVPNYADPNDALTSPFRSSFPGSDLILAEGESKNSWKYFSTINRTLVLLQVLIPPLSTLPSEDFIRKNPAQAIAKLEMREVTVRRWLAGRMRD
ncbi:tRNA-splicing endonuclease subunit Sen2, partial [Phenoliferia sp. Uapishka_3]